MICGVRGWSWCSGLWVGSFCFWVVRFCDMEAGCMFDGCLFLASCDGFDGLFHGLGFLLSQREVKCDQMSGIWSFCCFIAALADF